MTMGVARGHLASFATLCMLGAVLLPRLATPLVVSGDELRYSLGTVQPQRELTVAAGGSASTTLSFYNIDGNVPTVVELSVADVPAGWSVTVARSGAAYGATSVSLVVHPTSPRPDVEDCDADECEALLLPPRGHVFVESVVVTVRAPRTVPTDARGTVRLVANATWAVDGTAAPFPQEREFVFDVVVADPVAPQAAAMPSPRSPGRPLFLVAAFIGAAALVRRLLVVKSGQVA